MSGALLYLYTLTQYTARVYFSALLERPFAPSYVSMLLSSPYAKYFYGPCVVGWMMGVVFAVGRVRVLVAAGLAAFVFFLVYAVAFMLLDVAWWLPLPFYVEHSLAPLFMVSAFAGCWSAGSSIIRGILGLVRLAGQFIAARIDFPIGRTRPRSVSVQRSAARAWIFFLTGLVAVGVVPMGATWFALERAKVILALPLFNAVAERARAGHVSSPIYRPFGRRGISRLIVVRARRHRLDCEPLEARRADHE